VVCQIFVASRYSDLQSHKPRLTNANPISVDSFTDEAFPTCPNSAASMAVDMDHVTFYLRNRDVDGRHIHEVIVLNKERFMAETR